MADLQEASISHDSDSEEMDSDEELREAFAAGLLKPGLNSVIAKEEKVYANDVKGIKRKLDELKAPLEKFPWIERLDHVALNLAPLAPELALEENEHAKKRQKCLEAEAKAGKKQKAANLSEDSVHNDFIREMSFYRQAQATVLEVLQRLKSMGIPTKRPTDYFAQMAKSDQHMNKIREKILSKQSAEEKLEKIRKLRELKKFGKKVQHEVQQKRLKEKREMLDQVKKFKKGQTKSIDFLEDEVGVETKKQKSAADRPGFRKNLSIEKRKQKDKKFGFGGKKRGAKMNTKSSVNDVTSYRRPTGKKGAGKSKVHNKRPGKSRRQKMKTKGKK